MKKIKKTFLYIFGLYLSFASSYASAAPAGMLQSSDYGVMRDTSEPTFYEKIISIILSPIFIATIVVLAFIIGIIVFTKRRKKIKNLSNKESAK